MRRNILSSGSCYMYLLLALVLFLCRAVSSQPAYQCVPVEEESTEEPTGSQEIRDALSRLEDNITALSIEVSSLRLELQAMSSIREAEVSLLQQEIQDVSSIMEAEVSSLRQEIQVMSFSIIEEIRNATDILLLEPFQPATVTATPSVSMTFPRSCKELKLNSPFSQSGYYLLNTSGSEPVNRVFCNFEIDGVCGGDKGWLQVAHINMSDPLDECPFPWSTKTATHNSEIRRLCGRTNFTACNRVPFSSLGMNYTRVCGRVLAYGNSTPNAFEPVRLSSPPLSVEDVYVDGIVVSKGSPKSRQHVWTFAASLEEKEDSIYIGSKCPCSLSKNKSDDFPITIPSFVQNHYFCEAGATEFEYRVYWDDPLWDGQGCSTSSCCSFNNPPWFSRTFNVSSDELQVSLCADGPIENEEVLIETLQLYVQ